MHCFWCAETIFESQIFLRLAEFLGRQCLLLGFSCLFSVVLALIFFFIMSCVSKSCRVYSSRKKKKNKSGLHCIQVRSCTHIMSNNLHNIMCKFMNYICKYGLLYLKSQVSSPTCSIDIWFYNKTGGSLTRERWLLHLFHLSFFEFCIFEF